MPRRCAGLRRDAGLRELLGGERLDGDLVAERDHALLVAVERDALEVAELGVVGREAVDVGAAGDGPGGQLDGGAVEEADAVVVVVLVAEDVEHLLHGQQAGADRPLLAPLHAVRLDEGDEVGLAGLDAGLEQVGDHVTEHRLAAEPIDDGVGSGAVVELGAEGERGLGGAHERPVEDVADAHIGALGALAAGEEEPLGADGVLGAVLHGVSAEHERLHRLSSFVSASLKASWLPYSRARCLPPRPSAKEVAF